MKLRAIIADDEPLARDRLRALLRGDAEVEINRCRWQVGRAFSRRARIARQSGA